MDILLYYQYIADILLTKSIHHPFKKGFILPGKSRELSINRGACRETREETMSLISSESFWIATCHTTFYKKTCRTNHAEILWLRKQSPSFQGIVIIHSAIGIFPKPFSYWGTPMETSFHRLMNSSRAVRWRFPPLLMSSPRLSPPKRSPPPRDGKGQHFLEIGLDGESPGKIYPICSMYSIFTYIWVIYGGNVGKYSIHGAYGRSS